MPSMIFHSPFPLDPESNAASGIRPVQMRWAFENLGYDVFELTGFGKERKGQFRELKRRVAGGEQFDFMYSESSTKPLSLTEPNNLPRYPILDYSIFRFAQQHSIPVGLFYRDIYWKYPEYLESVGRFRGEIVRIFYRLDLAVLRKLLHTLFLPSQRMHQEVGVFQSSQVQALPPASPITPSPSPESGISLFYVGGLGTYYQLHECIKAVVATQGATMTICTPESNWELHRAEYEPLLDDSIRIVHARGEELKQYFDSSHIGVLFMRPVSYREFAAPLKFYEYAAHGKPIIASAGTLVGDQVDDEGIGWSIPYSADALRDVLRNILDDPELLLERMKRVHAFAERNTWEARAQEVVDRLTV